MLLVLGLDGADWAILDPWLTTGRLPHLAALRQRGLWGPLRSTIRPESSIAWTTFATGVDAGRHGVYSFSAQRPDSYETTLVTSASPRHPTFWQRASAAGRRLALLNVPITYPPQPLPGGVNIAGMLAPGIRSSFVWPPDLRKHLLTAVPDYTINIDRSGLSLQRFIQKTAHSIQSRARAATWLLTQQTWDAFIAVFTETDRLQHYTLHLLAPNHPQHDPAEAAALLPLLLNAYQTLDQAVGELIAAAGPEATVILLSDHGFAPCARTFHPNTWLAQQGLLVYAPAPAPRPDLWRRLRGHAALRQIKNRIPLLRDWKRPPSPGAPLTAIDWPRTAAVFSPAGGIRFNIRGREPQGILSLDAADALAADLIPALLALTDPATSAHPITAVHRRSDLYHGPHVELAPDLILEPRRSDPNPALNTLLAYDITAQPFTPSGDITGNHTLDGIFLAAGPDIPSGDLNGARLIDLAPTLLHSLGLPVPNDSDGRVLPLWSLPRPVIWAEERSGPESSSEPRTTFAADEQSAIEAHLRALGYL